MRRPLDGITVIEAVGDDCCLALRLSAALAGRIVADLGAEVVKIEPADRRSAAPDAADGG